MSGPTIEIHGTGSQNRGAELMAIAIAERMRGTFPDARIAVPPGYGSYESRARHGLRMTTEISGSPVTKAFLGILPKGARRRTGLVRPGEVDVVLDASGFSFSDQWGARGARRLAAKMARRARTGQPLVLLPQAFGPFRNQDVASQTRRLLERATRVFARDARSGEHLASLGYTDKVRLCPDFTLTVRPVDPGFELPKRAFVAIVPNARMLDKGTRPDDYLSFLRTATAQVRKLGLEPAFVVHDQAEDHALVDRVGMAAEGIRVFTHADPRALKFVLGQASFVIGSRFHALASALYQRVPCIGAGWSHKYAALFADFGCSDLLVEDLGDADALATKLAMLATASGHSAVAARLDLGIADYGAKVEAMWQDVESIIRRCLR